MIGFGDLGQVYPIARGSAPLMTAILATFWLDEGLGTYGWIGVTVGVRLGISCASERAWASVPGG